jgi:hypothetical protein
VPSLYEQAGGSEALHRLEEAFYTSVLVDPLLQPPLWYQTRSSTPLREAPRWTWDRDDEGTPSGRGSSRRSATPLKRVVGGIDEHTRATSDVDSLLPSTDQR